MENTELQLYDIYDISFVPFWKQNWFMAGVALVCGALLFGVLYWYSRRTKKTEIRESWQKSFDALTALKKTEYADHALFYTQLTFILKAYLEERFSLPLQGMTDAEFLDFFQQKRILSDDLTEKLKILLNGVVFIKFAHQKAAQEKIDQGFSIAQALIKATRHDKTHAR